MIERNWNNLTMFECVDCLYDYITDFELSRECRTCGEYLCSTCRDVCALCENVLCNICKIECISCKKTFCNDEDSIYEHYVALNSCEHGYTCNDCLKRCSLCEDTKECGDCLYKCYKCKTKICIKYCICECYKCEDKFCMDCYAPTSSHEKICCDVCYQKNE
jgi:hypothetical protein